MRVISWGQKLSDMISSSRSLIEEYHTEFIVGVCVAIAAFVLFYIVLGAEKIKLRGNPWVYYVALVVTAIPSVILVCLATWWFCLPVSIMILLPLVYTFCFTREAKVEIHNTHTRIKEEKRNDIPDKYCHKVTLYGSEPQNIPHKSTFAPPLLERDGYIFGGWFIDTAMTTPWKSTDAVTCDITLYPKWTKE